MSSKKTQTVLAAAALAGCICASAGAERVRNHFDSDAPMRAPGFFDFVVFGGAGSAQWRVVADFNPPSAPNKLMQIVAERPTDSIAAALRRSYAFRDGTLSIGLKKGRGMGGLALRVAGEKDFLLLLVDLASGQARLSSYRDGKAAELARGTAPLDFEWGTLAVTVSGPLVTARWNGKALLEGTDPKPVSGRAGPATAGPGAASFDEFVFEEVVAP